MNNTILLIAVASSAGLCGVIALWSIRNKKKRDSQLRYISSKLENILINNTDEKVMTFTDDKLLANLIMQINDILTDRQRLGVEYFRAQQASKQMLSNISHDIKTPLTVILGYLEMMLLQEQKDGTLIKVQKKAEQVLALIQKFFTLAKLEAGDTDLEMTHLNINEICRETMVDFYQILTDKDFTVDISIPDKELYIYGNRDAVVRILVNLISNAVRYGDSGKFLGVLLYEKEEYVFIEVSDKGEGIDGEFLANIFDRLYIAEDSRNKNLGGSGLGLAIVKSLVEKLDGDIQVESVPKEKTIFTVKLKIAAF